MMPQYVFALVCGNKQKARQHDKYTDVEQRLFTLNSRIIQGVSKRALQL
jgi:hypothetical protein